MSEPHTVTFDAAGKHVTMRFSSALDHIARTIEQTNAFYEAEMLADLRSRLFFPACAVDVGAHVGNHTLYLSLMLGVPTIAFEPNPVAHALLEANVNENGVRSICRLRHVAIGSEVGRVAVQAAAETNTGMARVCSDVAGEVPLVRLDDELGAEPRVDVIKIDVEGWELKVLQGSQVTIARHRPLLYIEIMEPEFQKVHTYLGASGYLCWKRFNATPTFLFLPQERLGGAGTRL
jgi:FkbM family methyltransferase